MSKFEKIAPQSKTRNKYLAPRLILGLMAKFIPAFNLELRVAKVLK